jgi:uncharacterized protein
LNRMNFLLLLHKINSLFMQTVLITGGTGLAGTALTALLVQKGYRVIILSRSKRAKNTQSPAVSYAQWDVAAQTIDVAAVQEADFIVHLAGAGVMDKRWTNAYKKEIVDSRVRSSELIVNTLTNNPNKIRAVISASAIGIYGPDTAPAVPFTEDTPADNSFLGNTCRLWEAAIEPVSTLGKRLVKLRIGIVLSRNGGALAEFEKPLRMGVAAILGNGRQIISWLHIDDLCGAILFAIENDSLSGTFNAAAPAPVSNKALTLTLARQMKGKFFIPIHVPAFVLKLILGEGSIEILKSTTVDCKKIQLAGYQFTCSDIKNALER